MEILDQEGVVMYVTFDFKGTRFDVLMDVVPLGYYVALIIILIVVILVTVYDKEIVHALEPTANKIRE